MIVRICNMTSHNFNVRLPLHCHEIKSCKMANFYVSLVCIFIDLEELEIAFCRLYFFGLCGRNVGITHLVGDFAFNMMPKLKDITVVLHPNVGISPG